MLHLHARRTIRLYLRLLGLHLRAAVEYEADFLIMVFAAILTQVVSLAFLSAVFARVPELNGWSYWAVVLMFAMVAIGEGVVNLFFEGMWQLAPTIHFGDLDYLLVRPYPVVLQVTGSSIGLNGLGNLLTGAVLLVAGLCRVHVAWRPSTVLAGLVLFASGVTIKVAITLATNAAAFWIAGPHSMLPFGVHQLGELARYPLAIYPVTIRIALGVLVPFAFVGFFPVAYLTGDRHIGWIGLLTPLVAAYCLAVAVATFQRGLRRYESSGN